MDHPLSSIDSGDIMEERKKVCKMGREGCDLMTSGHDMAVSYTNLLCVNIQDLHRIKSVRIPTWAERFS